MRPLKNNKEKNIYTCTRCKSFNFASDTIISIEKTLKMINSKNEKNVWGIFSAFNLHGTKLYQQIIINFLEQIYKHHSKHNLKSNHINEFNDIKRNIFSNEDAKKLIKELRDSINSISDECRASWRNSNYLLIEKVCLINYCHSILEPEICQINEPIIIKLLSKKSSYSKKQDLKNEFIEPITDSSEIAVNIYEQLSKEYLK